MSRFICLGTTSTSVSVHTVRCSKRSSLRKWLMKIFIAVVQFKRRIHLMTDITTPIEIDTDSNNGPISFSNFMSEGYQVVPQTACEIIIIERVHKFSYNLKNETFFWDITENNIKDDESALYTEMETTSVNFKEISIIYVPLSPILPDQETSADSGSILSSTAEDIPSTNSSPYIDVNKVIVGKG